MDFRSVLPLVDMRDEFTFKLYKTNEDFISEIVEIYFSTADVRVKESTLAVFMAYRDHYPTYLKVLPDKVIKQLSADVKAASGKIIKLRRIALSALSKVA